MHENFTIAICQFNASVGDIEGNTQRIISYIKEAEKSNTDLIIFPELTITGYSPMDLLYYSEFSLQVEKSIDRIFKSIRTDIKVIIGAPIPVDDVLERSYQRYYNAAIVLDKNGILKKIYKTLLPNYGIFQEKRQFVSNILNDDPDSGIVELFGLKIGVQICEDMWSHLPIYEWGEYEHRDTNVTQNLSKKGAELIINISASPFVKEKSLSRLQIVKNHAGNNEVVFIYVNEVGAIDEVVFDGRSIVSNKEGELVFAAPPFKEGLFYFNSDQIFSVSGVEDDYLKICELPKEEELIQAITLNLTGYLNKIGFDGKLLVALSGGIDSAITASLCVNAVGPERVVGVSLPSRYSSQHSKDDARELSDNLGIEFLSFTIDDIHQQFNITLGDMIKEVGSLADENIQSRIRGVIMMYLANLNGSLLISTGNKSEIAVGYCTLYGDTAGAKNLIGDLYKTEVYEVSRYINDNYPALKIPERTINKEPSAELREGQKDSDSLPPYDKLDKILELMIDYSLTSKEIVGFGYDYILVERISKLVRGSEFKRAQMVQTVKLTENTFGMGRIVPVATPFRA